MNWTRTDSMLPPTGVAIEWISPGGQHVTGRYEGGAVWFPEGSTMYAYYRPEFWRRLED